MNKPFLSVIIPAYNEAKRIPLTLIDIDKHLSKENYSYEIIVVDDGSMDATAEIVKRFSSLIKNLRIVCSGKNEGKGAAVALGMSEAKGNLRLFTDADNSASIREFNNMIPIFKDGYEVVMGSRNLKGSRVFPPQPLHRRLAGGLGSLWVQITLLPGLYDTQCGFKAFTENAAQKIFPLLKTKQWGFDIELLVLARLLNLRIKETPIAWADNIYSHVKMVDYPKVLWETLKIRWRLSRNIYNEIKH